MDLTSNFQNDSSIQSAHLKQGEVCIGTREISIRENTNRKELEQDAHWNTRQNKVSHRKGMIAVYSICQPDTAMRVASNPVDGTDYEGDNSDRDNHITRDTRHLRLELTDGSFTFCGRIDSSSVKYIVCKKMDENQPNSKIDDQNKMAMIASDILKDKSNTTVAYELQSYGDDTSIVVANGEQMQVKMVVKEALGSIVRVVWKGYLRSTQKQPNQTFPSNALKFVQSLAQSLQNSNTEMELLRQHCAKLESERLGWKDTATKLDKVWQQEKDELTDRFLILFNKTKANLRQARNDLEILKQKDVSRTVQQMGLEKSHHLEEVIVDHEDEHDVAVFRHDEVERLAMGPVRERKFQQTRKITNGDHRLMALPPSSVQQSLSQSKISQLCDTDMEDSTGLTQHEESQSSFRKNPITNAIEIWSTEAMFSQNVDDPSLGMGRASREGSRRKSEVTMDNPLPDTFYIEKKLSEATSKNVDYECRPKCSKIPRLAHLSDLHDSQVTKTNEHLSSDDSTSMKKLSIIGAPLKASSSKLSEVNVGISGDDDDDTDSNCSEPLL